MFMETRAGILECFNEYKLTQDLSCTEEAGRGHFGFDVLTGNCYFCRTGVDSLLYGQDVEPKVVLEGQKCRDFKQLSTAITLEACAQEVIDDS